MTLFVINAIDKLTEYAIEHNYTENQIKEASVSEFMAMFDIIADSDDGRKYAFFAETIKAHICQRLFPVEPTDTERIKAMLVGHYHNVTVSSVIDDIVTLDLNRS